jgi:hypothetical protein
MDYNTNLKIVQQQDMTDLPSGSWVEHKEEIKGTIRKTAS